MIVTRTRGRWNRREKWRRRSPRDATDRRRGEGRALTPIAEWDPWTGTWLVEEHAGR